MDTVGPAIPKGVQWRPFFAKWHTFDVMDPPERLFYQGTRKSTSGNRTEGKTSRPPSEPSSEQQSCQSASPRQTSAHAPSVQGCGVDLLISLVDPDTIRLVRRWCSNTMIRYLHMRAKSFTKGLSDKMFKHGAYALIPPAHSGN